MMHASGVVLGQIWQHLKPFLKRIVLAVFLGVFTLGSSIGLLGFSAYLLAAATLRPPLADLALAILCVRVFGFGRGIWRYLERLVSHDLTFRFLERLRLWFYQSLVPLSPAYLWARPDLRSREYTAGDLLSRFVADIDVLQEISARALVPWGVALVIGCGMYFMLQTYQRAFALLFLVFYLLSGMVVPLLALLVSRKLEQSLIRSHADLHTTLIDCIQGMADLLAFERAEDWQKHVGNLNQRLARLQRRQALITAFQDTLNMLLADGCVWTLLLLALPLARSGQVGGVYLAGIVLAVLGSFEVVGTLAKASQRFGGCLEAARRLTGVANVRPVLQKPAISVSMPLHFTLEVRNLSFRYTKDGPLVLDNVSFVVPQGHCVAIVGPSGAGKSTLAHVLLRFCEYEEGSMMLGGYEVNTLRQEDLVRWIGVVEQQTHIFNTTVRENLSLARPEASQAEIEQAAHQALVHDVIQALPQGYETPLGEQGFTLSGGERQRLALARAFLKKAPFLLLDEPTAHLDALTEQAVFRSLRASMQGQTAILITHRFIGLEMADEILVLEQGHIKERGKHNELLQAEGLYWKHWTLQQQQRDFDPESGWSG